MHKHDWWITLGGLCVLGGVIFLCLALLELDRHSLAGFCYDHDAVIERYESRTIQERDDYRGVRVIKLVTCRVRLPGGRVLDEKELGERGVFFQ